MSYIRENAHHLIALVGVHVLAFMLTGIYAAAHDTPRQACINLSIAAGDSVAECSAWPTTVRGEER